MTVHLGFCQILVLVLYFLSIVVSAYHHGKPRENHNVGSTIIAVVIMLVILYFGGFFS